MFDTQIALQNGDNTRFFLFTGRKTQAIELYLKGIDELNKGISLDVTGQGARIIPLTCIHNTRLLTVNTCNNFWRCIA